MRKPKRRAYCGLESAFRVEQLKKPGVAGVQESPNETAASQSVDGDLIGRYAMITGTKLRVGRGSVRAEDDAQTPARTEPRTVETCFLKFRS
jgi:hypothetical protein